MSRSGVLWLIIGVVVLLLLVTRKAAAAAAAPVMAPEPGGRVIAYTQFTPHDPAAEGRVPEMPLEAGGLLSVGECAFERARGGVAYDTLCRRNLQWWEDPYGPESMT